MDLKDVRIADAEQVTYENIASAVQIVQESLNQRTIVPDSVADILGIDTRGLSLSGNPFSGDLTVKIEGELNLVALGVRGIFKDKPSVQFTFSRRL